MRKTDAHNWIDKARRRAAPWRALLVAALLLAPLSTAAQPARPAPAATQTYDIQAQPLDLALTEFGTISRIDILYENGVVDGKRSTAVSGVQTPDRALAILLQGTNLLYRFTSANAVLIFPPDRPPEPVPDAGARPDAAPRMILDVLRVTAPPLIGTPSHRRFEPFGRAVQDEINQRLQNDPRTSARPFHARLAVHIDDRGVIERLDIVQSTGDPQLDRSIRSALADLRMPYSPPEGLPQPIWFELAGR